MLINDGDVITITNERLVLQFPCSEFCDTDINGLMTTCSGSDAGTVKVIPWSQERIDAWYVTEKNFKRYGHHVAALIKRSNRSVHGSGFAQRASKKCKIALYVPPKNSVTIQNCIIDARDLLDE